VAQQSAEAAAVILERATEVGATLVREGLEFGVVTRAPAVGGQMIDLQGLRGRYDEIFLPLYGVHQAQNAAAALAAVEAFFGGEEPLSEELVRAAFAEMSSPGRLEIVRRSPTIVLDAAHNPHGAEATAAALDDSFQFSPLIGVIGVMGDKDAEGLLAAFEPHLEHVVITQSSTARAMPADRLAVTAREVFGEDRVSVVPLLADAIDEAAGRAESGGDDALSSGAVLVTGSVVTVGEARVLLGGNK
jgi:dihydrofolate synthase/folylpolyglutamate synthase